MPQAIRAVTFDLGQTLVAIDPATLVERLAEIGIRIAEAPVFAALGMAFAASDRVVRKSGAAPAWHAFMDALLQAASVGDADRARAVPWLFEQQRVRNLWRRPIPGMIALCRELGRAGVPVGLITNSEGRAAELVAELGWTDALPVIADSGVLGLEKPAPRSSTGWRLGSACPSAKRSMSVTRSLPMCWERWAWGCARSGLRPKKVRRIRRSTRSRIGCALPRARLISAARSRCWGCRSPNFSAACGPAPGAW